MTEKNVEEQVRRVKNLQEERSTKGKVGKQYPVSRLKCRDGAKTIVTDKVPTAQKRSLKNTT